MFSLHTGAKDCAPLRPDNALPTDDMGEREHADKARQRGRTRFPGRGRRLGSASFLAALACALLFAVCTPIAVASAQNTSSGSGGVLFASSFEHTAEASIDIWTAQPPQGFSLASGVAPLIAVNIHDPAGLDFKRIVFTLDGNDIARDSRLGNSIIIYEAPAPLAVGQHRVDIRVGSAIGSWTFNVVAAPSIAQLEPNGLHFTLGSQPPIEALIVDQAAPIVTDSIQLILDGRTITDDAELTCVSANECRIRYLPPQPLVVGAYRIEVGVGNTLGMEASARTMFYVDPDDIYVARFESPGEGTVVAQQKVDVVFTAGSNASAVRAFSFNGMPAQVVGYSGGYRQYGATLTLRPGDNTITALVEFENGQTRSVVRQVTYDAPPLVSVSSPLDWQTFGPLTLLTSGYSTNLTGSVERPTPVTGTTSRPVVSVTVNQQQAQLSADGRSFTLDPLFLHEGTNLLSVNAVDALQRVGTTELVVFVDYTAPLLTIERPATDAMTSASRIDVRGVANDAVEGGVNAPNPIVVVSNTTNAHSITASVHDRYYVARELPLEVGNNTLRVVATDAQGNARVQTTQVTRVAVGTRRITLLSGDRQSAPINTELPQPLVIAAMDADGLPLVDLPVQFDIERGAGSISLQPGQEIRPDGVHPARNLLAHTDASGRAQVWLKVGSEAGESGNMLRAWNADLAEDAVFTATGQRGDLSSIQIKGASGSQYVQTQSQPLEALTVIARDAFRNPVLNAPVKYQIEHGDAYFNSASAPGSIIAADGRSITANTDKDGLISVRPHTGSTPGVVEISASSAAANSNAGSARFQLMVLERRNAPTQFGGVVMDQTGTPLAGIRLSIGRTTLSTTSDADGRFLFEDQVPPGKIDLFVDGRALHPEPGSPLEYPALHFETAVVQGQANQLPHPIYLPAISHAHERIVGGDDDVVLTVPGYEGFEMIVKAHSVTFPDGSRVGPVVVTPVHRDRLPMVAPGSNASFSGLGWTIQPTGTRFDPPITVRIPNVDGMKPGETASIVQWDHDLATFVPMGRGTVNESGTQIVSDNGSGITKAGWGGCQDCPPIPPNDGDNECPNPSFAKDGLAVRVAGKVKLTADGRENKLVKAIATVPPEDILPDPAGTNVALLAEPLADCGGLEITWDFGDGTPTQTGTSASHNFMRADDFDVTVTGRCTGCNETIDPAHIRVQIFKIEITKPTDLESHLSNANPPVMPDLEFEATVTPAVVAADLNYEWSMETKFKKDYNGSNVRDDTNNFPDGGGVAATSGDTGRKWKPEWGAKLVTSKDTKVKVKAFHPETPASAASHERKDYKILGDNPAVADVNVILGSDPYFLRRMVQHESAYLQFNAGGALGGLPNFGYPRGFGIMQHDPATTDQVYNWHTNVSDGPIKLNAKLAIADTFWPNQVTQYNQHQAIPTNPRVAVHADVDEGGSGCLFSHATGHTFRDPIWIKAYNGAARHYMVWSNANPMTAQWVRNELNAEGRNYVNLVCNTVEP